MCRNHIKPVTIQCWPNLVCKNTSTEIMNLRVRDSIFIEEMAQDTHIKTCIVCNNNFSVEKWSKFAPEFVKSRLVLYVLLSNSVDIGVIIIKVKFTGFY